MSLSFKNTFPLIFKVSLHCYFRLRHIYLIQPRKTRPYITERLLMGRKELKSNNRGLPLHFSLIYFKILQTKTHVKIPSTKKSNQCEGGTSSPFTERCGINLTHFVILPFEHLMHGWIQEDGRGSGPSPSALPALNITSCYSLTTHIHKIGRTCGQRMLK